MPEMKEKVALITAASSGIGKSTALHFASMGIWFSLMARNDDKLQMVADACRESGISQDKVLVVPGDVSVEVDVNTAVDKTVKHFGKIDILVNNAGTGKGGRIDASSLDEFSSMWATNVQGAVCMARKTLPFLRQTRASARLRKAANELLEAPSPSSIDLQEAIDQLESKYTALHEVDQEIIDLLESHEVEIDYFEALTKYVSGCIVNVSSVASLTVLYKAPAYSMSKAALDQLTKHAALENAPFGVRVNSVNPGFIKTAFAKAPGFTDEEFEKVLEQTMKTRHSMGRIGSPEEVARCIAFLASEDASFVTGVSLPVDGGLLLMSSFDSNSRDKFHGTASAT
ncbi:putative oxidoreductase TM_0325 [Haemaphysalis longicornis]